MFDAEILLGDTEQRIIVQTSLGSSIRNAIAPEPGEAERRKYERVRKRYGSNWTNRKPACGRYNCFGMVFASRRTAIYDDGEVRLILGEDGYRRVLEEEDPRPGDLVLYRDVGSGIVLHVGVLLRRNELGAWHALSKWNARSAKTSITSGIIAGRTCRPSFGRIDLDESELARRVGCRGLRESNCSFNATGHALALATGPGGGAPSTIVRPRCYDGGRYSLVCQSVTQGSCCGPRVPPSACAVCTLGGAGATLCIAERRIPDRPRTRQNRPACDGEQSRAFVPRAPKRKGVNLSQRV